jgi:hypothetical protein
MVTAFRSGTMGLIRDLLDGGSSVGLSDASLLERFAGDRDEAAFAALVTRHGGMVWNTCRAVLKEPNAVDDAFQATFVLLFRKAATIRGREALGCCAGRNRPSTTTGPDGRFRIEGLVPGVKYDVLDNAARKADGPILDGVQVGPGEVKDVGDVALPTYKEK